MLQKPSRLAPFGTLLLALLVLPAGLTAQEPGEPEDHHMQIDGLPDGWMAHFDAVAAGDAHAHHAAAEGLEFMDMAPGWHITTGPSGIFYRHGERAAGDFAIETEIHLFDPGERRESFGLFVGGTTLHDTEARRYTYFLVRRDGQFMIRERVGTEVRDIVNWTEHAAIRGWDDRDEGDMSVPNVLRVEVRGDQVVYLVNGSEVSRFDRGERAIDGHYGLRVNHNLNLHVTRLDRIDSP
jgi:hypothetical protein